MVRVAGELLSPVLYNVPMSVVTACEDFVCISVRVGRNIVFDLRGC